MAPFGDHNGAFSANFDQNSNFKIQSHDEDGRFRDAARIMKGDHQKRQDTEAEINPTRFQTDHEIHSSLRKRPPADIETSRPSSPIAREPSSEEQSWSWSNPAEGWIVDARRLREPKEAEEYYREAWKTLADFRREMKLEDGEKATTRNTPVTGGWKIPTTPKEELTTADLRAELRKIKEEIKEWTYEHISKDLKVLSEWMRKMIKETQQQNEMNREHTERLIRETSEHTHNQLYDRISNNMRRDMEEMIGALERSGKDRRSLIVEKQKEKEHEQQIVEKTRKEQTETKPETKTKWEQILQTQQKWEREQRDEKQFTSSEEEREGITITDLRCELTRMKKETQEWTYEHISKDLKVIVKWMIKHAEEERARQEHASQEEEYKQVIRQIMEETRNQLYDRITNDMKISMFNVIQAIKSKDQEIEEERDRHEIQREDDEKHLNEMMKRNSEILADQIITMFKKEQEQMWKWLTTQIREMEERTRPIHNRRHHWRHHGGLYGNRSENGRTTTPHPEERSEDQHNQQTPPGRITGDEETQEHKIYEEEEEEEDHSETPTHASQSHIKRRLIRALKEKDDIRTAILINHLRERINTGDDTLDVDIPIIDALCKAKGEIWPMAGSFCSRCNRHATSTTIEKHFREVHNQEMKDEMIITAERLTKSEIEEENIITMGVQQKRVKRHTYRCHHAGCTFENENFTRILTHRDKHEGWKRRTTILGVFWGKIKQEMELSGQEEFMPNLKELMGECIQYKCSCGFGSYSREKVQRHKEEKGHWNDIIQREISFVKANNETQVSEESDQEKDPPDQRYIFEEVEEELKREKRSREDIEAAIRHSSTRRTEVITAALGNNDVRKAIRAFINLKYRERKGETRDKITLETPITEILLQAEEEQFPPIHQWKYCPHCNKLFPKQQELKKHMEEVRRDNGAGPGQEDIRTMFVTSVIGKVRQFATTIFGETLEQTEEIYRCKCPGCNYISLDQHKVDMHLIHAKDNGHRIFLEEAREFGEIFAMIRGYIRKFKRAPTIREFLGDYGEPHRVCTICGEIISSNAVERHGRRHEEWKRLAPEEKTKMIKISFVLKDQPDAEDINRQREEAIMNGTRADLEEATDRIYQSMMREDELAYEQERPQIEAEIAQRREEYIQGEEENARRREAESQEDLIEIYDISNSEEEISEPPTAEEGSTRIQDLLQYITSDTDPRDTGGRFKALLDEGEYQQWTPEAKVIETLQCLDRAILTNWGMKCMECNKVIMTELGLFTHMTREHGIPKTDWFMLTLAKALHKQADVIVTDIEGRQVPQIISMCHEPGCCFIQLDKGGINAHIKRMHEEMAEDIERWGILMAVIRRHLKRNPNTAWKDILKEREAYQCECGAILKDEASINKHFSMTHSSQTRTGWRAKYKPVTLRIEFTDQRQEDNDVTYEEEINEQHEHREENTHQREVTSQGTNARQTTERNTNDTPERPQNNTNRNNEDQQRRETIDYYIRKREQLLELEELGVNLRCANREEADKIKEGLQSLFKNELIPKITKMKPETDANREWLAFEGAYLECMDTIRRHIARAQGIPEDKIYRRTRPPRKIDKAKTQRIAEQRTSKLISKLRKWITQEVEDLEETENNPRSNRNRAIRHSKICEVMRLLTEMDVIELDVTPEELIRQIADIPEHRQRVMIWLDGLFTWSLHKTEPSKKEKKEIRDAYRDDPKTAMTRFVIGEQAPDCTIDPEMIQEHYEKVWAASATPFIEAQLGDDFWIERQCRATDEDIRQRLLDEELLQKIVKSRRKLSANGPDGVGYRIMQLGGKEAIRFLQELFAGIWKTRKVPTTWKMAKTILLYKKGDTNMLQNWRPISLTNCIYRIFTAVVAEIIQEQNRIEEIFSNTQKGFISRCNGCTEHSIMINEIFNDARRMNKDVIAMTIDCTNAFGSVPLELITSTLRQRGIPESLIAIIRDTYTGASTKISTLRGTTEKILWRKGVKQGCPLSPLLFNLCLEPLFAALKRNNQGDGIIRWIQKERVVIQAQAYADDIILISDNTEAMKRLISTTESFLMWSQMEVNTKKCFVSSYVKDEQRHRATISEIYMNGEQVRCLSLDESMQYLGVSVAARRKIRFKNNEAAVETFTATLEKIRKSPLTITQKIHAIRMFLMPTLDYVLLNGEMRKTTATRLDKRVRATIGSLLEARGIPKAQIHASWKDGGMSIPSIEDRQKVLTIRSFLQMVNSKDNNVKLMMRQAIQDERKYRKVQESENSTFINWKDGDQGERSGTGSIIVRARAANEELKTKINVGTEGQISIIVGKTPFVQQENRRKTLGWVITNAIIRPDYIKALRDNVAKGDLFEELTNNKASNYAVANSTPYPDNLAKFMIVGRCNLLATPNNIAIWTGGEKPICSCGKRENALITLKHILNDCGFYTGLYMKRHNRIMQMVRELIIEEQEVEILAEDSTTDTDLRLKPDLVIKHQGQITIIDATCPYGGSITQQTEEGQLIKIGRSMERAFHLKLEKYRPLQIALRERYHTTVEILPVVVSSLGVIYKKTESETERILKITKKKRQKLMKRLSKAAVEESYKIWLTHSRRGTQADGEQEETEQREEEEQEEKENDEEEDESEEEDINQEDIREWPQEARDLYGDTRQPTTTTLNYS